MFDGEWEQRSLFGWETSISKIYGETAQVAEEQTGKENDEAVKQTAEQYCAACRKSFSNQNVYDGHLKGKRHIKAAA